jgi:hypothetical protein
MKTLPFLSRNLFLIFALLFPILFLGSCENLLEQTPVKNGKTTPEIKFEMSDCISISPSKMKVLYIGVDNPILIDAPGIDPKSLKISVSGGGSGTIKRGSNNLYIVNVTKPAPLGQECEIRVSAQGVEALEKFRVKRIPDPLAMVSNSKGGEMGLGEFKAQGGVSAQLDDFDFDAKCMIQGFILSHISQNEKVVESSNRGPRYIDESRELINAAKPGDIYTFHNVKAKCPGDAAARKINSMVFKIK